MNRALSQVYFSLPPFVTDSKLNLPMALLAKFTLTNYYIHICVRVLNVKNYYCMHELLQCYAYHEDCIHILFLAVLT